MADYGLKISRPGYDVSTATAKQLAMTSKHKTFKVAAAGTQNVSLSTGWYRNQATIAHGLGYVPAFVVYGKQSDESVYNHVPWTPAFADIGYYFLYAWADSTYLYLEAQYGFGSPDNLTYNFKYYIFDNQIE